ncbi:MAG TPA: hypothetical protein VGR47_03910 [Terracidiphilus sp.]|nr:hypothetical protein [Terracidiphilus sp.]
MERVESAAAVAVLWAGRIQRGHHVEALQYSMASSLFPHFFGGCGGGTGIDCFGGGALGGTYPFFTVSG